MTVLDAYVYLPPAVFLHRPNTEMFEISASLSNAGNCPHVSMLTCKKGKSKVVPLQAWSGPEGSRKLRFPDFMTTAQDGGKVVSLTHRPPLPQEMHLVLIFVRG